MPTINYITRIEFDVGAIATLGAEIEALGLKRHYCRRSRKRPPRSICQQPTRGQLGQEIICTSCARPCGHAVRSKNDRLFKTPLANAFFKDAALVNPLA